jgi:hypothetical protein
MSTANRRQRILKHLAILSATLAGVSFLAFIVYRHHISFRLITATREYPDSTPVLTMPRPSLKASWNRCRLGSLTLEVPETMARNGPIPAMLPGGFTLRDNASEVVVFLPTDATQFTSDFRKSLSPSLLAIGNSKTALDAAAYAASWRDFRWSMSSEEVLRHRVLLNYKLLCCYRPEYPVEIRKGDTVEGLLIREDRKAWFEWYSTDGSAFGKVLFESSHSVLDLNVVRGVCHSLAFDGVVYPERMTDTQTRDILATWSHNPISVP